MKTTVFQKMWRAEIKRKLVLTKCWNYLNTDRRITQSIDVLCRLSKRCNWLYNSKIFKYKKCPIGEYSFKTNGNMYFGIVYFVFASFCLQEHIKSQRPYVIYRLFIWRLKITHTSKNRSVCSIFRREYELDKRQRQQDELKRTKWNDENGSSPWNWSRAHTNSNTPMENGSSGIFKLYINAGDSMLCGKDWRN